MKKHIYLIAATALFFVWAARANAADCDFSKQILELGALKGEASSSEKELSLRQDILNGILDCLTSSTQVLKSNYDSLPYLQTGINLKTRFMDQLSGNLFYYGEKKKVVDSADIPETKLLAKEIMDWKAGHEGDLKGASYFLLWLKNQNLLALAQDRASQISNLKLSDKNQANLIQAQGDLAAAASLNSSAQAFLEQSSPDNALSFVKQTLQKLMDSYRYFIKITDSQ